jgi:hypothetical protein
MASRAPRRPGDDAEDPRRSESACESVLIARAASSPSRLLLPGSSLPGPCGLSIAARILRRRTTRRFASRRVLHDRVAAWFKLNRKIPRFSRGLARAILPGRGIGCPSSFPRHVRSQDARGRRRPARSPAPAHSGRTRGPAKMVAAGSNVSGSIILSLPVAHSCSSGEGCAPKRSSFPSCLSESIAPGKEGGRWRKRARTSALRPPQCLRLLYSVEGDLGGSLRGRRTDRFDSHTGEGPKGVLGKQPCSAQDTSSGA